MLHHPIALRAPTAVAMAADVFALRPLATKDSRKQDQSSRSTRSTKKTTTTPAVARPLSNDEAAALWHARIIWAVIGDPLVDSIPLSHLHRFIYAVAARVFTKSFFFVGPPPQGGYAGGHPDDLLHYMIDRALTCRTAAKPRLMDAAKDFVEAANAVLRLAREKGKGAMDELVVRGFRTVGHDALTSRPNSGRGQLTFIIPEHLRVAEGLAPVPVWYSSNAHTLPIDLVLPKPSPVSVTPAPISSLPTNLPSMPPPSLIVGGNDQYHQNQSKPPETYHNLGAIPIPHPYVARSHHPKMRPQEPLRQYRHSPYSLGHVHPVQYQPSRPTPLPFSQTAAPATFHTPQAQHHQPQANDPVWVSGRSDVAPAGYQAAHLRPMCGTTFGVAAAAETQAFRVGL